MNQDRMQRQRFELKYVVDERIAEGILQYASTELELDEAGRGKPNQSYRVNSLYLDSVKFTTFWRWVNADRNRFKLRMRFYDERPDTPVFLEIKRRLGNCILKQRCALQKSAAPFILAGMIPAEDLLISKDAKSRTALVNFVRLVGELQARPKALVTYWREAYVHPENDSVRVTLDREVRIAPRVTADFNLDLDRYEQPFGDQVILELKFTNRFPDWFAEMVRLFGLTRSAAAKYCEGVAALWHPELGNRNLHTPHWLADLAYQTFTTSKSSPSHLAAVLLKD